MIQTARDIPTTNWYTILGAAARGAAGHSPASTDLQMQRRATEQELEELVDRWESLLNELREVEHRIDELHDTLGVLKS